MNIWTLMANINKGKNIAEDLLNNGTLMDTDTILGALFDTRFSNEEDLFSKKDSLIYFYRDDLPALQKRKVVRFKSGRNTLYGYIYKAGNPKGLVLLAHGIFGQADDYHANLANYFLMQGYSVFAFDMTASGRSGGIKIDGLHQSALDVNAAESYIASDRELSRLPLFLLGFSWGAYGVTASLNFNQTPVAVCEMSGFASPMDEMLGMVTSRVGSLMDNINKDLGPALQRRAGPLYDLSAIEGINKAKDTAIMMIHGENDKAVNLEKSSIYGSKKPVTNSNVVRYFGQGKGHGDIFLSYASITQLEESEKAAKKYLKDNDFEVKKLTKGQKEIFWKQHPKFLNSQLDYDMLSRIDSFFMKALR